MVRAPASLAIPARPARRRIPAPYSQRQIALLPPARDALLTLDGDREGRVFSSKRGGPLSQPTLTGYWQRVTARAGRSTTPYELRHFAAHHLYVTMASRREWSPSSSAMMGRSWSSSYTATATWAPWRHLTQLSRRSFRSPA